MLKLAANLSMLFTEWPLRDRFAAARDAGFDAVELQFPYAEPADVLARAAEAAGIEVALINAPIGPDPASLGLACLPGAADLFRSELERGFRYAMALGSPCINVLAGRSGAADWAEGLDRVVERLAMAAELCTAHGVTPLLEALNPADRPDYCVTDFETAVSVLRRTGAHVRLQFDVYHATRMGLDPCEAWERWRPHVGHVQIADCAGRHEPGTDRVDWRAVFNAIRASDYAGWVGAEYVPLSGTLSGLGWRSLLAGVTTT
ncbi:MAG TPA: TIM barrel protein [Solirubrobacteraceae bacterium]|nr:TIM barrel protein [Solirubrobacteraceae bacterium]